MSRYKNIPLFIFVFLIISSFTVNATSSVLENGLNLGDSGEQVKVLQSKLSEDKTLYPSGLISGYYGKLTQQAVINFQRKYSLAQTGNLDSNTLEKFNQIYGDNIQSTLTPVPKKNVIQSFFDFITFPIRTIVSLFIKSDSNGKGTEYNIQTVELPTQIPTPTTYYIVPTNDPDPFVNCGISAECGGGTKLLRSSVCSQSSCCQIGNSWIFYESHSQCLIDQNSYNSKNYSPPPQNNTNSNNNYTYPTSAPWPTLAPWPTYAPMPTYIVPKFDNSAALSNCINQAYQNYQSAQTFARESARASGGGDDSAGLQAAANTYSQAQATCHNLYGY